MAWCTAVDIFLLSASKLPWHRLLWFLKLPFTRSYKGSVSLGRVLQRTNAWGNQMASRADPPWHMHTHATIWTKLLSNIWQGKLTTGMGMSPLLYIQDSLYIVCLKMCGKPSWNYVRKLPRLWGTWTVKIHVRRWIIFGRCLATKSTAGPAIFTRVRNFSFPHHWKGRDLTIKHLSPMCLLCRHRSLIL